MAPVNGFHFDARALQDPCRSKSRHALAACALFIQSQAAPFPTSVPRRPAPECCDLHEAIPQDMAPVMHSTSPLLPPCPGNIIANQAWPKHECLHVAILQTVSVGTLLMAASFT